MHPQAMRGILSVPTSPLGDRLVIMSDPMVGAWAYLQDARGVLRLASYVPPLPRKP